MAPDVRERRRAYVASVLVHGVVCTLLVVPWPGWLRGGAGAPAAVDRSPYVPLVFPSDRQPAERVSCGKAPCLGEDRRHAAHPDQAVLQGEELQFQDDTGHALMPALGRAGGWVALVPRSDRQHALALYRAIDGTNVGTGIEVARFPLRVVVQEPESYPQIAGWIAGLGVAPESLRTIAIFPSQTQRRLRDAIDSEARRAGLADGPRRVVVAVSADDPGGIIVRSVSLREDLQPSGK